MEARKQGTIPYIGATAALVLPALAHLGRWSDFDESLREANSILGEGSFADPDVAAMARRSAEACGEYPDREVLVLELARDQFERLGRVDAVVEVKARLAELQPDA